MIISVSQLVDRTRHRNSRAKDLARLRARFVAAPTARDADPATLTKARRLRTLRREMAKSLRDVRACRGCSKGQANAHRGWDGGHCCGSRTLSIFTVEEVAALKLGGTTPSDLKAPDGDHAGCAFRGPRGCSLTPENRPSICLRYLCLELREEVRKEPGWHRIVQLSRALVREFP